MLDKKQVLELKGINDYLELLNEDHFVVLDIETTGFSPKTYAKIIEIAAVRVVNGQITDKFHTFINPGVKIPKKITDITGITNEQVKDKPYESQIIQELLTFINGAVIVAHNLKFDWNTFLLNSFENAGLFPSNKTFCTLNFFKLITPELKKRKLDIMCDYLGVTLDNHHSALSDTESTAKCLLIFKELYSTNTTSNQTTYDLKPLEIPHTPITILKVKYWEKKVSSTKMLRRHYIYIKHKNYFGTIFLDIPTKSFNNKDFKYPLNFKLVEKDVLEFLGLKTFNDLLNYKN